MLKVNLQKVFICIPPQVIITPGLNAVLSTELGTSQH